MNRHMNRGADKKQGKDEGMLEKIADTVDPSGREISDDELIDPGANIKDEPAERKGIERKPPGTH